MLIIHSVDYCDAGSYACKVSNEHGTVESTAQINVTDVRCHFESSFSEYSEVVEGQDIEFCCNLSDEDGVVFWYKDGKLLSDNDSISIIANNEKRILRIRSVKDSDSGTYRCETSDGRSRTEGELFIKEEEPQIIVGPQDDVIKQFGCDVMLRCELTKPANRLVWFKNGEEIWQQTNKYMVITSGCSSVLKIQNFGKNDIGSYHVALNEKEVSATAHLRLEVVPEIRIHEQYEEEIILNIHEELAFHVEVSAFPVATVTILHNDLRVQNRALVEQYDDITSVRMKNLTVDDCGIIKIIAENAIGIAERKFHVTVMDVPAEPINLNAKETTSNSTILSWSYAATPYSAPVTEFIVERKSADSNRWRIIGKTKANTLSFEADDLLSKQVYGFRVTAVNSVGEGPASHPIDVLTLDDEELQEEFSKDSLLEASVLDSHDAPLAVNGVAVSETIPEIGNDLNEEMKDAGKIAEPKTSIVIEVHGQEIREQKSVEENEKKITDKKAKIKRKKKEETKIEERQEKIETGLTEETRMADGIEKLPDDVKQEKFVEEDSFIKKVCDFDERAEITQEEQSDSLTVDGTHSEQLQNEDGIKLEKDTKIKELVLKPALELVELKLGESRELIIDASEEVQFHWTKNGRSLEESYSVNNTKTQSVVKLPAATLNTSGIPILEVESTAVEVKDGESAKLYVNVVETKGMKCTWRKDGKLIKPSKNMVTSYRDGTAQLTIKKTSASDNGVYTVPDAPEGPIKMDIDGKICSLTWKPPLNDGRSSVLGYYIEKYNEKTNKWTFVARCTTANYKTEHEDACRYRIAAENSIGLGAFIESETIPSESRPKISCLYDSTPALVFNEGDTATLSFSFTGQPTPNVEWINSNGKQIVESKTHKIESTAQGTTLSITDLHVSDSGKYKLKIKNRCGEDSIVINIQAWCTFEVNGRPRPPGKPIVKERTAESILLSWTPPKQDGGSPVRQYTVEMCTVTDKKWKKADITKKTSLKLFNLVPGETFIFRVRAENTFAKSEPSEESEPLLVEELSQFVDKKQIEEKPDLKLEDYDKLVTDIDTLDLKAMNYTICEELGKGAYGTVYRAIEKSTGKTWAAKVVQVRPGVKRDDVLHEISVMSELHHDKLLKLHEAFDLGYEICLIVEFVSGGELFNKIVENDLLMTEEEARNYVHQILLGIEHMHNNQFVHLDLKPENILIKTKNSTDLKIIDFGLARKLIPNKNTKLLFGTPEFCAPEIVNHETIGLSADMWSVGVITLSSLSPFHGDTDEETLANVSAANWDFNDPLWSDVSDTAKDFIRRLMTKDKRQRMTVKQALKHPWITTTVVHCSFQKTQSIIIRNQLTASQKKIFMALKRWSECMLPIGRLARHGAIFRQQSMDGVFARTISFDTDTFPTMKKHLEDTVAHVGDLIATLTCEVDGNPLPWICWFKDNKELKYHHLNTTVYSLTDWRN
ncbi:kinase domain protein [Dictyocaulus viviparus]|uniref:Kinase domain protein n=1 Tax=Dictyocaulus viviparus TaxID=29172 RepID=A0A0D8XFH4_DICVI|nr:kinase domain protein [Dictyocaulus viviparus]